MNREKLISVLDSLAHKNRVVARKVQGTVVDRVYHWLLEKVKR